MKKISKWKTHQPIFFDWQSAELLSICSIFSSRHLLKLSLPRLGKGAKKDDDDEEERERRKIKRRKRRRKRSK